ncbi:hypothetical protein HYU14_00965 [Candidatus Woesearchaeota archaeon]|nr:hypothetical protein [Candidatus Woesearchaeota archaeon]
MVLAAEIDRDIFSHELRIQEWKLLIAKTATKNKHPNRIYAILLKIRKNNRRFLLIHSPRYCKDGYLGI